MIEAARHSADDTRGLHVSADERVTLCEALDRVLNKGAVLVGEATISVVVIDLIYVDLQVVLPSIESARRSGAGTRGFTREATDEVR